MSLSAFVKFTLIVYSEATLLARGRARIINPGPVRLQSVSTYVHRKVSHLHKEFVKPFDFIGYILEKEKQIRHDLPS